MTYGTDRVVPVWEIKAFNIDLNGKTFTTNSNQGITLSNNGYGASAICYGDNENTSPARNITVSNGTIRTAYGAGLYFDAAVTATLENLTVAQNYPANVQSTDEYSTAVRLTSGATVNIYSGTYSGKNAIAISNSGGYANIYGGDFRGVLFINGGASSTKVLTIYGGTFDHDPTAYVADGYVATQNDGVWTVTEKMVASVSGVGFSTLEAAIAASESGDTVTVLADISLTDYITIDSELVIDLNGYTVSTDLGSAYNAKGVFNLTTGANVTINDSSAAGTGAITATGQRAAYGISVNSDAAAMLVVNGGYIFGKSSGIYTNTNAGTVTINGGYVKSTGSQGFTLGWGETYLVMNGGTIESESTYAIWIGSGAPANDPSTATINGGKIITPKTEGAICVGAGNVVIGGGDFTETNRIFHNRATAAGHNFTFVIRGGTFASMTYTNRVGYNDSEATVSAYLADGCIVMHTVDVYKVV